MSVRGERLGYMGVVRALKARADDAGVDGFHLHRLRHTAAVRWMQQGGSQVGLMAQAGWSSPTMVARYVKAASERLAAAEFDRELKAWRAHTVFLFLGHSACQPRGDSASNPARSNKGMGGLDGAPTGAVPSAGSPTRG